MPNDLLERATEFLKLANGTLTREDFIRAFQNLTRFLTKTLDALNHRIDQRLTQQDARIAAKLRGLDGKPGKDGAPGRQGPKGDHGESIKGDQGAPGKPGRDGSPDTPEHIRAKLQSLSGDNRLDKSAIKGLEALERQLTDRAVMRGGTGPSIRLRTIDLSAQCDGATKTFKVPSNFGFAGLFSTQFPNIYRPLIDYTGGGTHILTLTAQVGAPDAGQTLILQYFK